MTSVTPIERTASATLCPCDTSTSTWRSFATISSGLCLFLGIVVLLGSKAIPQGGPLQRGRISEGLAVGEPDRHRQRVLVLAAIEARDPVVIDHELSLRVGEA